MKSIIFYIILLFSTIAYAQMPSMDNFMAPAEDEPQKGIVAPTEIQNPDQIMVDTSDATFNGEPTQIVEAANTQDAINKAIDIQQEADQDITTIKVGSGIGVVARGQASYQTYPNRNASLLSKRQAYVKAYMFAKKNLAEYLYGLNVAAKTQLAESYDSIDTDQESLANTNSSMMETNEQKVEGILRGFVVYRVNDDTDKKEVSVSIVTTPKTRGQTIKANSTTVIAKDFADAMKQVLAEIKTGLAPPMGGKVISVPNKSQLFFASYGSEINRYNKNPMIRRKQKQIAMSVAKMRAKAALSSLIIGEQNSWSGKFENQSDEKLKQFDEITRQDALNQGSSMNFASLGDTRNDYLSRIKGSDTYRSVVNGNLPPGLQSFSWSTDDWTYALYVYNPFSTKKARQIASDVQNSNILNRGQQATHSGSQAYGYQDDTDNENNQNPISRGPSGQVSSDDEL